MKEHNKIYKAMNEIHAESQLKEKTRQVVFEEIRRRESKKKRFFSQLTAVTATIVVLCSVAGGIFYVPVSAISLDVNPSLELQLNCLDRVIRIKGQNEDGRKLCDSLNIGYKNYADAVTEIIENELEEYDRELITVTVMTGSEEKSQSLLCELEECQWAEENVYCTTGNRELVEEAHENGFSFGKYKVYQELVEYGAEIPVEEAQNMSMRELYECLSQYTDEVPDVIRNFQNGNGQNQGSQNGNGNGNGQNQGSQNGNGKGNGQNQNFQNGNGQNQSSQNGNKNGNGNRKR